MKTRRYVIILYNFAEQTHSLNSNNECRSSCTEQQESLRYAKSPCGYFDSSGLCFGLYRSDGHCISAAPQTPLIYLGNTEESVCQSYNQWPIRKERLHLKSLTLIYRGTKSQLQHTAIYTPEQTVRNGFVKKESKFMMKLQSTD